MKITSTVALAVLMLCVGTSTVLGQASQATVEGDGSVRWQAGVGGVEFESNPDGSWRIFSRGEADVTFPDRRGIYTAQTIAEEKAKAAIAHFMGQDVASGTFTKQLENDVSKAIRTRDDSAPAQVRRIDDRTVERNVTEATSSIAAARLRGVIVLEKGYEKDAELAWVKVGISNKTIAAAQGLHDMISGKPTPPAQTTPQPGSTRDNLRTQPSEIRRSNQKDW